VTDFHANIDSPNGTVFLVGSGPGDPDLLTLKGQRCIATADVILYDYLSNQELLKHARPDAVLHCLGSHAQRKVWTQSQINAEMVRLAQSGKSVVRLKSGDPTVFARAADEIDALIQHKIPFQIVPGVTSALAAGAYTGIPVTHSTHASAVAFITGHEATKKTTSSIDWHSLATFPGTLVIYMGVTTAPDWSAKLIAAGKLPSTPVAIVRRCSWPDQETFRTTLENVGSLLHPGSSIRPPAIVVVGQVASAENEIVNWFENRPLFGKTILVARPEHQAESLKQALADLGADVVIQPAIQIRPVSDFSELDQAIDQLEQFDWLAFSSRNGVRCFFDRLFQLGFDLRKLGQLKLAAIGSGTAEELANYHLNTDLIPDQFRAESLVAAIADEASGKRFLLPRASRGRDVLPLGIEQAGGEVTEVVVYESTDSAELLEGAQSKLKQQPPDMVLVTSSAIARSLHQLIPKEMTTSQIVSISPVTSQTLHELGYQVSIEATTYTMDGIVEAILKSISAGRSADSPGPTAS